MIRRRLPIITLVVAIAFPIGSVAAATSQVTVDNTLANTIAVGAIVNGDPADALLTVQNGHHFWAAIDLQAPTGGASLHPAALDVDIGGLYAAGGLIAPSATAAYQGTFDASRGGSQAVRVHYDLSSAGGAAAIAANLLTVIADALGASLVTGSASKLSTALQVLTSAPGYADFLRAMQRPGDIFGLVSAIETLLGTSTGRGSIIAGLASFGVTATETQLVKVASVVGIIDWAYTLVDLLSASWYGQTDGTTTFSLVPVPPATPTGVPTASVTPALTPNASSTNPGVSLTYVAQVGTHGAGHDQFSSPAGIAADGEFVYIADAGNHRIVKRRASNLSYVSEVAGQGYGPFAGGVSSAPFDLATDGTYLYVANTGWNRIEKLTVGLAAVARSGSRGSGPGQFDSPYGVATDGQYLYVADSNNQRIVKLNASDLSFVTAKTVPAIAGQLQWLAAVAADGQFLFVTDQMGNRVIKLAANDLSEVSEVTLSDGDGSWGIAATGPDVYVSSGFFGTVRVLRDGDLSVVGVSGQPTGKPFMGMWGMAADSTYLYVDDGNDRIVQFRRSP